MPNSVRYSLKKYCHFRKESQFDENDVLYPISDNFDSMMPNHRILTPLSFIQSIEKPSHGFNWENTSDVLESNTNNKHHHFYSGFNPLNQYQYEHPNQHQYENFTRYNEKPSKIKPLVLEESSSRFLGTLKFFDENKSFGFIIMDINNSEIFFHFDDFDQEGKVSKETLMGYKKGNIIRLSFGCLKYIGRYNISLKAVEIKLLSIKSSNK